MKNNRVGQAAIISDADYQKIRLCAKSKKYKTLLDLARYTGERWGAIVSLQVSDVFVGGNVRSHIVFPVPTRNAQPAAKTKTRSIPVHPVLEESLTAFGASSCQWLFPNSDGTKHITVRAADLMFRSALAKANLTYKGYSTHSTRRTFVTRLYQNGVDLHTIQSLAGYSDLKALMSNIKPCPDRIKKAIAHL